MVGCLRSEAAGLIWLLELARLAGLVPPGGHRRGRRCRGRRYEGRRYGGRRYGGRPGNTHAGQSFGQVPIFYLAMTLAVARASVEAVRR